jgi:hypothetical protein
MLSVVGENSQLQHNLHLDAKATYIGPKVHVHLLIISFYSYKRVQQILFFVMWDDRISVDLTCPLKNTSGLLYDI